MTSAQPASGYTDPETLPGMAPCEAVKEPARIAVYTTRHSAPTVVRIPVPDAGDERVTAFLDDLSRTTYALALEQGGRLPLDVIRELVDNLIHACFNDVVITILDGGNTLRISDRGPGIPDKQAALRAGFTSAEAPAKQYIRGVGSGLALVSDKVRAMDGDLEIEDNLGRGTVVTVRVAPVVDTPLAPAGPPAYNLAERQLKALLLTVELAPVGPTRLARELGVATSTAYRDLIFLEEAGLVVSEASGHRLVTEAGLAYLNALL